jgi:hypothetical protein
MKNPIPPTEGLTVVDQRIKFPWFLFPKFDENFSSRA